VRVKECGHRKRVYGANPTANVNNKTNGK